MTGEADYQHTLLKIRSHMNAFTKTEVKAASYILDHPENVIYCSVTELAEKVNIGETTVLRFCRKLGFSGFQDFKLSLAQDLVNPSRQLHDDVSMDDDVHTLSQKLIAAQGHNLQESVDLLSSAHVEAAIDTLITAKKVMFFGVGASGLTAQDAAHRFSRIGKECEVQQDSHFQAMAAAGLTKGDVAVGLSISGSTKDTVRHLELAREAGARIICLTSNAKSPITKVADIELLMTARENPLQGGSLSGKIAQLAIIDILAVGVAMRIGDVALRSRNQTAKAVSDRMY
ncbi:MurR/RpiR family transcriptional regulator [Bacillaceae bacterium SIJ1]|uniref:MurR/RpiR family transcriptional regulator n=1 Tax=Litoribacterium kuwaitense TaxID=1398745 RepID=UPI0013EDD2AA|nr:MurR/RpiR family transcriptional regulator [Litoribacterium kuwaitense]NGP44427.1 MurR/RpiR family transcriptional regulator [Litoribacterium kuwaitense]